MTNDERVWNGTWNVSSIQNDPRSTVTLCGVWPVAVARTDLDSHADSPCVGKNSLIVEKTGRSVNVSVALPSLGVTEAPIVTAAVTYDAPSGESYVVVINQALYFHEIDNNLIGPNMIRMNGVRVNDTPKSLVQHPTNDDHAIIFDDDGVRIPLSIKGVISYFPT